jgi:hypothetical protein
MIPPPHETAAALARAVNGYSEGSTVYAPLEHVYHVRVTDAGTVAFEVDPAVAAKVLLVAGGHRTGKDRLRVRRRVLAHKRAA